jgi:prepilin-type N-terminal cleavage/methylation domain-containing protein
MSHRIAKPGRHAFTLVEMLCVMALFALLGTILTLIILGTLEIERTQAAGFDRLLQNKSLAEQFRADVSAADDAPAQWHDRRADEHRLILHMKTGEHVVYVWRDKILVRQIYAEKQSTEAALQVGGPNVDVEFVPAEPAGKLVRLRLHTLRKGKRADGESLEIAAALGGDWR